MALPVEIVGVTSGTLTVSGLAPTIFSPASVQPVRIIAGSSTSGKLITNTGAIETFTYGAPGGGISADANAQPWNDGEWAVARNGSLVGISIYTNVVQTTPGNIDFIAQHSTDGVSFQNGVTINFSSSGNGIISVAAQAAGRQFPVQAGEFIRLRIDFQGFVGTINQFQGMIIVEQD